MEMSSFRDKIRYLCEDFDEISTETFTRDGYDTFVLDEENINSISQVKVNTSETTGYTYDSDNNEITITMSGFADDDVVQVKYTYNKYSDTEIDGYIQSAVNWISVFTSGDFEYEVESGDFFPTPDSETLDLIAIVASIIIKPNYSRYSMPGGVTVNYPKKLDKDEKIKKLVENFYEGLGTTDTLKIYDISSSLDKDVE